MALHLETSELRQELCTALKEEERRKRTEEMKKRAIHTATNYDEFRHLVSCAQLKSVTRKEMEMLSDQKRGWQQRSDAVVSSTSSKDSTSGPKSSSRRVRGSGRAARNTRCSGALNGPLVMPADHCQFQRDWRRMCTTDDVRCAYLRLVGPERLQKLFHVEMEPDVLGQMLVLICNGFPSSFNGDKPSNEGQPEIQQAGSTEGSRRCEEDKGMQRPDNTCTDATVECMAWLSALSRTGRFGINIKFLEKQEKRAVADLFDCLRASLTRPSEEDASRFRSLQQAYSL